MIKFIFSLMLIFYHGFYTIFHPKKSLEECKGSILHYIIKLSLLAFCISLFLVIAALILNSAINLGYTGWVIQDICVWIFGICTGVCVISLFVFGIKEGE